MSEDPIFIVTRPETELTAGELDAGITSPGWYFWDETWTVANGPFGTRKETEDIRVEYIQQLGENHE